MGRVGLASAFALVLFTGACRNGPADERVYVNQIAAERSAKDSAFEQSSDPVPTNRHSELLPLAYFPIDPSYDAPATLRPSNDPTIVQRPTSIGGTRQMRRAGTLEFMLKGQQLKLTAFIEVGAKNDRLFVPFTDLTTGTETYPGGRYLDLDRSPTGIYVVDFNRAYQPYCYYNPTYDCPYPPPENRLNIPVRAGERFKH